MTKSFQKLSGIFLVLFSMVIWGDIVQAQAVDTFFCSTDSLHPVGSIPTTGTVKAVAIYACGSNASTDTLPVWWAQVWDTARQHSIPRLYKDNSLGQYIMLPTPYGRDAGHCFKASIPFQGGDAGIFDKPFFDSIMTQADAAINFANFDGNNDDTVDAFFLVFVNHGGSSGRPGGFGWTTNDISVNGRNVVITGNHSTRNIIASEARAVHICSHEWGHVLGNLPDLLGGLGPSGPGQGVGSFSIMGNGFPGLRTFPFDPWSRAKLGWVTPINVTTPLYGQSIPDYFTSGTVYRLAVAIGEYFLVTNHWGLNPPHFWEDQMPGRGGLMIWHVREISGLERLDVELAHGMWDRVNCSATTENRFYGEDSLDLRLSPCGYSYPNLASATCWWNFQTKNTFDGLSNPSSDYYGNPIINGIKIQNIPTHLAVRNIQAGNFSSATADLLVNNWFGHITQNTTWSNFVAMTGDVTVDSGFILTISPGTVVYAQYNEDNQRSGVDTMKCEIIVKAGGRLVVGGPGNPVKFISSRPENSAGTDDWRGIVVRPGGYVNIENAIIRHAYAAIEDSSAFSHTIKNVKIGRCKIYGIKAVNTDSLTIRGCRIDSVNASPGGFGIYNATENLKGARLVADTVRTCWYGIYIRNGTAPVESCLVQGDSTAVMVSNTGIESEGQGALGDTLSISHTSINGYFSLAHLDNFSLALMKATSCNLVSSSSPRSPTGIRNTSDGLLKLRKSTVAQWGSVGVLVGSSGESDLGTLPDSGFNTIYTFAPGTSWKYVKDNDCPSCGGTVYAEWNCWGTQNPSSSRFSSNVDYTPFGFFCLVEGDPKLATGKGEENRPDVTALFQNYPNPFNPTTQIQFTLAKTEPVRLEIFNILGQKVKTMLGGEEFSAGPYTFIWDGRDDGNVPVSSGTYVYKLATPSFRATKKMILVK